MLRREFDFKKSIDVLLYLRMSSDKQNPNSPAQQRDRIETIIANRNLPWRIAATYQDEALSGMYARKRPGFTKMLHDIENGTINVGAILVDTIERFGRMDDLDSRRRRLANRHNVVILSADRNFSDPYSPESHAMSMMENHRANDSNRIKANDVNRGKIGSINNGYWPGSPVPFGFKFELVQTETRHRREIKHHTLAFDDIKGPIICSLMKKSAKNPSWGQGRLTVWLNERADIPDEFKPFHASTVGRWLRNPIYRGTLVWSEYSQGVIDDRRVLEKNDEQYIIRVEGFCEPIAPLEILKQVDANIELRKKFRSNCDGDDDHTKPQRGVNYSHPLTGLVRCGHCGASMVPNSTAPYTTKSGDTRIYCAYMCPNSRTKACENSRRIKEEWLREVVIEKILERLAPDDDSVAELVNETRQMVMEQRTLSQRDVEALLPQLQSQLVRLEEQIRGWAETLAKPGLHRRLREDLESQSGKAYYQIESIEQAIQEAESGECVLNSAVQPDEVKASISQLHEKILSDCPTAANLELSMHIDTIECFADGSVRSRICKIGSSPVAVQWFSGSGVTVPTSPDGSADSYRVKPRRRALLRLDAEDGEFDELMDRIHTATDPNRFAELPEHWFWIDEYRMPEKTCWVQDNAQRVLARFEEIKATGTKPSLNAMSKEFGKSRPTISRALDIATGAGDGNKPEHRREPKLVKGNPELESQIAQLHDAGKINKEIAEALGLGRSTVTMALDRLYKRRGLSRPDGRRERHQ